MTINEELRAFNPKIMEKPQVIIANKMDLEGSTENLKRFKEKVTDPVYPISAMNNEGIDQVLIKLADLLDTIKKEPLYEDEKFESHVLYKFKEEQPFKIHREGDTWVIVGDQVEKILKMTKFSTDESVSRFANKLRKLGIDDKLRELGAQDGDPVRILDFEFEYRS